MGAEEILSNFYGTVTYVREGEGWRTPFDAERLRGSKLVRDLIDADTGEVVAKAGDKITQRSSRKLMEAGLKDLWVPEEAMRSEERRDGRECVSPGRYRGETEHTTEKLSNESDDQVETVRTE